MNEKEEKLFNDFTLLKALDDTDRNLAIKAINQTNLSSQELNELIECSIKGTIVEKNSKIPLRLSNELVMVAIKKRFNKVLEENKITNP